MVGSIDEISLLGNHHLLVSIDCFKNLKDPPCVSHCSS